MGLSTIEICTTAPVLYLLINANAIESQKLSLSDMKNLKTVC